MSGSPGTQRPKSKPPASSRTPRRGQCSGSKQVPGKLDPPCRACKIEPHRSNLSTHHQRQADRIRPMQAASVPYVPRNRQSQEGIYSRIPFQSRDRYEWKSGERCRRQQTRGQYHHAPVHFGASAPPEGGGQRAGEKDHVVKWDAQERSRFGRVEDAVVQIEPRHSERRCHANHRHRRSDQHSRNTKLAVPTHMPGPYKSGFEQ